MSSHNSIACLRLTYSRRTASRHFAKLIRQQDPAEVEQLPVFQYATENTKRSRRVYMWGNTTLGALGNAEFVQPRMHKHPTENMRSPWRHPFGNFHKVRDIACGYGFTVFAASNEENDFTLFGTGLNSDLQIGYHCNKKKKALELVAEPVPIPLPLLNHKTKAIRVACGRAHTVVLTDKEGVFSLGNNSYGQLGVRSDTDKERNKFLSIHQVKDLPKDIKEVVCGQDHSMFLTESGEVYSCGWGADGQTGLEHYNNHFIPSAVKGDIEGEKIIQLSCSADCVLAVSERGDVFGWGNSEYKQFNSATDKQQICTPTYLKLNLGKVLHAASGGTMCAVLNENHDVYVWGYGILGQGPDVSHSILPTLVPKPLFGFNEFNPDVKVISLACGLSHFAAITNQFHLYMWGRNRYNCLGLGGKEKDQYFPFKVCVPAEVYKISCGVDHTAVLCRSFA